MVCETSDVDLEEVRGLLTVELQREVQLLPGGGCIPGRLQLVVVSEDLGEPPLHVNVPFSLNDIEASARPRYLAMLIAEWIRTGQVPPAAAESAVDDSPSEGAAVLPPAVSTAATTASALVHDNATDLAAPISFAWESGAASTAARSDSPRSTDREPGAAADSFRLRFVAGSRIFLGPPTTPTIMVGAALHWRRLSFHLEGFGARTNDPLGELWAFQAVAGVGVGLLSWNPGAVTIDWRLRGDVGVGIGTGDPGTNDAVAFTEYAPVAVAMTEVVVTIQLGEAIDVGVVLSSGFQQGLRVLNGDVAGAPIEAMMSLHGFFGGAQLALGAQL